MKGPESMSFLDLFLSTVSYIGLAVVLLFIGIVLFEITTKNKEFELIKNGNKAAVYAFGGRILGLAIVLYSSISNSVNIVDMVVWGSIAIVIQIIVFYLAELLTPKFNITKAIDDDNQAVGLFLLFLSVSIGLIIAASLTY
jgi:putative membrane protein